MRGGPHAGLFRQGAGLNISTLAARIDAIAADLAEDLIALRRDLHAHPELAFEEVRTARRIAAALADPAIALRTGVGRTGLLADIAGGAVAKGRNDGATTVLIRADMDALPIHEATGLPYASTIPGRMHACGHDLHAAIGVGVAQVVARLAPDLPGRIRVMFQPAEEILEGAQAMIAEGALDGVDAALGFHNRPDLPSGVFGVVRGATTAATDRFVITVRGKGGHTGRMHQTRSPLVPAAELVVALSGLTGSEVAAMEACVIGIGAIAGGSTHNAVPETCTLQGTLRARSAAVRDRMETALRRCCAGIATLRGVDVDLDYIRGVPAQVNDAGLFDLVSAALRAQLGDVVHEIPGGMGGEDFAYISERVPSFRLHVGAGLPGRDDALHTPTVQLDEACILPAVRALARACVDILLRAGAGAEALDHG